MCSWTIALYFAPQRSDCIHSRAHLNPRKVLFHFPTRAESPFQRPEKSKLNNLIFSKQLDYTRHRFLRVISAPHFSHPLQIHLHFQLLAIFTHPQLSLLDPCTITLVWRIVAVALLLFKYWGMCEDGASFGNRGLDGGITSHIAYLYCHLCLELSNANEKDSTDP